MEGDDAQPPAGGQALEDRVQSFVQNIQFRIDGDAYRLEGAPRGVFGLAALRRGHRRSHDLGKLHRGGDGLLRPGCHDLARDLPGVGFLPVIAQDTGQFFTVQCVDKVCGGGALLAHTHIERRVRVVGKTTGRVVQLVAGHAEVQQSPVDRRDGEFREHARGVAEVRLYHPGGQALEPFGGGCHRIRVLVERDQLPGGQTFSDLHTVPCPAGGPVQVNTGRVNGQPIQAGLQQHGYVRKFHLVFYLLSVFRLLLKSPVPPSQR